MGLGPERGKKTLELQLIKEALIVSCLNHKETTLRLRPNPHLKSSCGVSSTLSETQGAETVPEQDSSVWGFHISAKSRYDSHSTGLL